MDDYLTYEMNLRLKRNEAWDRHVECVLKQEGCGGDETWADYVRARDTLKLFTSMCGADDSGNRDYRQPSSALSGSPPENAGFASGRERV